MLRDERLDVASTWTDEDCERRRGGHVEMRHGARTDKHRDPHGDAQSDPRGRAQSDPRGDAQSDPRGDAQSGHTVQAHREIDRELRRIAKQRAGLDGQEARWLREAAVVRGKKAEGAGSSCGPGQGAC